MDSYLSQKYLCISECNKFSSDFSFHYTTCLFELPKKKGLNITHYFYLIFLILKINILIITTPCIFDHKRKPSNYHSPYLFFVNEKKGISNHFLFERDHLIPYEKTLNNYSNFRG